MKLQRQFDLLDQIIIEIDRVLGGAMLINQDTSRENPADSVVDSMLDDDQLRHSAALMRVNHAGEVAAQALYHGQSMTARNSEVKQTMQSAAKEEIDHLIWCSQRLDELGSRPSILDPLWYLGSFSIGVATGVIGDKWSLGFVAETEHQVVQHLQSHLERISPIDAKSRAILEQMMEDEGRHATIALESGAADLPEPVCKLMTLCSWVMTTTAYWI